jgi:hypothetical protein
MPSGLASSLASLASSLLEATPTDAVRPVSALIRARMAAPISAPLPRTRPAPVTSRKASSRAIGSMIGVKAAKISWTARLLAP